MEYKKPEVRRNGKLVEVDYKEIEATTEDELHTICVYCKATYTERPYICRCRSNTFLRKWVKYKYDGE